MAESKHGSRRRRKAQTEVISTVLLIGIGVAVVSVAYLWGIPLIQKGQSANRLQSAESTIFQIEGAVLDVVRGGGQKTMDVFIDGPLEVSDTDNSIIYSVRTKKVGVAASDWVPLNDDNMFGVSGTAQNDSVAMRGSDKAGVIVARASATDKEYITEYRLTYREIDDSSTKEGQLITIAAAGNNQLSPGKHTLTISREQPMISTTRQSRLGGPLTTMRVLFALS